MKASLRMHQIESKIAALQAKRDCLLTLRHQEITELISHLNLAHFEDSALVGGLLFLKDKLLNQDPVIEAWRDTGERFLRRTKIKKTPKKDGSKKAPTSSAESQSF